MNDRIQQLKKQAGAEDFCGGTDCMDVDKFAELIVRECAKIAGKAEYSDTWLEPVEDAIKKHFGVKE